MSPRFEADDSRLEQIPGLREERRSRRSDFVGLGSLACPLCDAPAPLMQSPADPATPLGCPYCAHVGAARDFLSFARPARAPRVNVYARLRA